MRQGPHQGAQKSTNTGAELIIRKLGVGATREETAERCITFLLAKAILILERESSRGGNCDRISHHIFHTRVMTPHRVMPLASFLLALNKVNIYLCHPIATLDWGPIPGLWAVSLLK